MAARAGAADAGDWLGIVTRCPIRETPARDAIARALGFQDRWQYVEAVLQLLRGDGDAVAQVRAFFGTLPAALGIESRPNEEPREEMQELIEEGAAD